MEIQKQKIEEPTPNKCLIWKLPDLSSVIYVVSIDRFDYFITVANIKLCCNFWVFILQKIPHIQNIYYTDGWIQITRERNHSKHFGHKTVLTERDHFFCLPVSTVIDKVGTILNVSHTIAKTQLIAFSRPTFCNVMTNPLIVKHRNVFGDWWGSAQRRHMQSNVFGSLALVHCHLLKSPVSKSHMQTSQL